MIENLFLYRLQLKTSIFKVLLNILANIGDIFGYPSQFSPHSSYNEITLN
jgi:hypothetical protein